MLQAFTNIIDLVTGDARKPEQNARPASVPMLSHFLGYRSFDEEKRIFHQVRSKGFIIELAPLVGANDRVNDVIGSLFSDILLPGTKFSVTNYSSPRVAEKLQAWALPRYKASGVFQTLARHRVDKLRNGAWSTLASDGPFFVRSFRVLLAVGISDGSGLSTDDLLTMREGIISALDSIDVPVKEFAPTDLIRFFDEILAPSTGAGDEVPGYNRFDPINEQCIRRDLVTHVGRDRLVLEAQSLRPTGSSVDGVPELKDFVPERFDVRTMAVRNFPDRWAPWDSQKVIGDIFNPKLSLPCPVLQTACGVIPNQESSEAKAGYKFVRTSSLAEGKGVKLVPKLRTEAAEWQFVADRVKQGEKLVSCYYAVTIIAPKGRDGTIDHVMQALKGHEHPFAYDLATSLLPFAAKGTYGKFFLGDANLDLSADLTVFELSDLATRVELRGVVLTSIMFIASQVMRRMDRAIPKPLIIDEAWQMLKGGAMADFVETYSRTCRKYGGALITATQSIHDYYKSEGSRAALENSDWFLILQQKGESTVYDTSPAMSRLAFASSVSQFANAERQQTLSELETARNTLSEERSRALSLADRTSSRQTTGTRNSSGSESSAGFRSGENLQRFDNQSLDARDTVSESDRVSSSRGAQQSNTDRLETTKGGSLSVGGSAGRGGNRAANGEGGSGANGAIGGNVQAGISGGRSRLDSVTRGTEANQSQGFDSSTSDNRSSGSNATQDSGSYSQSGSFSRSEGYSEKAFSREQALEDVRRIDKRIAAIDEVSKSLSSNTSSRDGYGSNLSFDLSQIIASRYQEKAAELGLTAPSLARTDLSPQEQATAEVVARAIIADYYDQRVAPFSDLIPESGSLVGNVSGPGSFTEADLRGQGPRRSAGSPRNLVEGASDSAIGNRIEEGGQSLGQRYETNVTRSGQRRQDFQQDRKGEDGADDRFNERFYDRDQR